MAAQPTQAEVDQHIVTTADGCYSCTICNSSICKRIQDSRRHVRAKHLEAEKNPQCSKCGKRFARRWSLMNHERTAHKRRAPPPAKQPHSKKARTQNPDQLPRDPWTPIIPPDTDEGARMVYLKEWKRIRTHQRHKKLEHFYNFRVVDNDLKTSERLMAVFKRQKNVFKCSVEIGYIISRPAVNETKRVVDGKVTR